MNCKRIQHDYEFYVLGALPEGERAEFDAHLAECPEPHPDFVEAAETMASLAMTVERVPVPDRVARRLFDRVDADVAPSPRPRPRPGVATPVAPNLGESGEGWPARLLGGRWAHPAMGLGVIAIGLLIGGGVWLDGRLGSVEIDAEQLAQAVEALALQDAAVTERVDEVILDQQALADEVQEESVTMERVDELLAEVVDEQTELASQVQTVSAAESEIMNIVKEQRTLTYMAAAPDRSVNMLWSSQRSASARGMMFMSNDGRIGLLAVLDLPPLPDDRVYQIWLIKGGLRTSGGTFTVDASGYGQTVLQLVAPVGEFDAIGITVEPAGGSSGPTGDQVLVGDL